MLNVEQRVCSYKKKIHNWGYELKLFPTLLFSASLPPGTNNCVMNLEIEEIKKKNFGMRKYCHQYSYTWAVRKVSERSK
jgi:hypothetical protein